MDKLFKQVMTGALLMLCLFGPGTSAYAIALPEFDCLIEPEVVADVGSPVDGIIKQLHVPKSSLVKKGDKLVQLNQDVNLSTVMLAKAQARSDEKIRSKKAYMEFAKRKVDRIKKLHKQNATSGFQKDEAETELKLARAELEQAKQEKLLAELEYRQAMQKLKERTIYSPFDGVVVKYYLSPGESVKDKPVLKLAKIHPLRVELILTSDMFGLIKEGMQASIIPESPNYKPRKATVTIVDKVIDTASGTFGVRLTLPNPDHSLPSGLRCRARITP